MHRCIDVCIYDIEKCFDALWIEDVLNNLHDSLPNDKQDNKLALVYEASKNNFVAIKTPVGLTDRRNLQNIVTQGGTFGPIECANSIDKIGQKSFSEGKNLLLYKKIVRIPPLGYIDDILTMAKCGTASLSLNTFVNTQIETKKLKFHTPDSNGKSKCHFMHVGEKSRECPNLQVHGMKIEKVESDTYLGDIISSDGKHHKTIMARKAKGVGIITQIMIMLEKITIGNHYFESALLLRESMFLNSILINSEIRYDITSSDLDQLTNLDKVLLRKILNTPISTPSESLYLELGCIDIETLLKGRRLIYFHYLTQRKEETMLSRFFLTQWKYPCKGDWTEKVKLDLEEFDIPLDIKFIRSISVYSFKNLVKKKAKEVAFSKFIGQKTLHSKLSNIHYSCLKLQDYFCSNKFSVSEARMIFSFRVRMAPFKQNFKNLKETLCPLCSLHNDDQNLIFKCPVIVQQANPDGIVDNIYSGMITKDLVKQLAKAIQIRNLCLKERPQVHSSS